jgi:hypothetical protein
MNINVMCRACGIRPVGSVVAKPPSGITLTCGDPACVERAQQLDALEDQMVDELLGQFDRLTEQDFR